MNTVPSWPSVRRGLPINSQKSRSMKIPPHLRDDVPVPAEPSWICGPSSGQEVWPYVRKKIGVTEVVVLDYERREDAEAKAALEELQLFSVRPKARPIQMKKRLHPVKAR